MAEENTNTNTNSEENKTQNPEGENPENNNTGDEKKFSQKDLDAVVQNRLKREKDSLTAAQKNWETEKSELATQIESLEKVVGELLSSQMEGLDESVKKLLAKLSVLDQVEWIKENLKNEKQEKSTIFSTPKPKGENTQENKRKFNSFF